MNNENNFNEMIKNVLSNADETLDEIQDKDASLNPYKLTRELMNDGFTYDFTGAYFPFKEEFQLAGVEDTSNFNTQDNLYLWASRNPDKKCEIICKWAKKTPEGFVKSRGFNIDFTLDIGDEKNLKTLNKKVAFSGGKNNNPSSEGSYVEFVDYFTNKISESDCLQVLKEDVFEFPDIIEDESLEMAKEDSIQKFNDYPEDIKREALKILDENKLFKEIQKSVSLTHQGHKSTRNALILMESSLFVGDGAHGLIGGESGQGKSDLAFAVAMNFPQKHVHILRNISPKNIYYDFESYDENYNILILDDLPFNDELVNLCKELTDNTKKTKELKTVINNKQQTFKLKGKYEIIITYAKTIPDEELANRLFNLGVTIIDKDESEDLVKYKIRDNNVIGGNDNHIIEKKRLIIQACIHYLLEQDIKVYNPFLSIFNPTNYNNRDVNHFINMAKAKTFFEYYERKEIKVKEDVSLTIGSYEDLAFVNNIWERDEEAQRYKLSERQKQILEILPEMTDEEAYDHIEELNGQLAIESRKTQKKIKEGEPLVNSIAKKLKCSTSTLKHDLDRFDKGTHKSLVELDIVNKIQLDEDNSKSPNFYYKVKKEGEGSNKEINYDNNMQNQFAHSFLSSFVKQKIIIDLLIYANIIINKKGIYYLKNYCENYNEKIDVEEYNSYFNFIQGFFDGLNYDEHVIELNNTSSYDIDTMMNFKDEIVEEIKNSKGIPETQNEQKICTYSKTMENPLNDKQSKKNICNPKNTNITIFSLAYKEQFEDMGIDVECAYEIYEILSSGEKTLQQITNKYCEFSNPDDFNSERTPLKVENNVTRLYVCDFIDMEKKNNVEVYFLQERFVELVENAINEGASS